MKTTLFFLLKLLHPYHDSLTICDLASHIYRLELPHLPAIRSTRLASLHLTPQTVFSPIALLPLKASPSTRVLYPILWYLLKDFVPIIIS